MSKVVEATPKTLRANGYLPSATYAVFIETHVATCGVAELEKYYLCAEQYRKYFKDHPRATGLKMKLNDFVIQICRPMKDDLRTLDDNQFTLTRWGGCTAKYIHTQIVSGSADFHRIINKIAAAIGIVDMSSYDGEEIAKHSLVYWSCAPGAYMFYDTFGVYPYCHEILKRTFPAKYRVKSISDSDSWIGIHNAAKMKSVQTTSNTYITVRDYLVTKAGVDAVRAALKHINDCLGKSDTGLSLTKAAYDKLMLSVGDVLKDIVKQ